MKKAISPNAKRNQLIAKNKVLTTAHDLPPIHSIRVISLMGSRCLSMPQAVIDAINRFLPENRSGLTSGALSLVKLQTGKPLPQCPGRLLLLVQGRAVPCW